jgi:hypothetical protein
MVLYIVRDARRAMNTLILLILVFDCAGNDMMTTCSCGVFHEMA